MSVPFPAFPKIFSLGTPQTTGILDKCVEVTEKIDGSQFAFGYLDGELRYRSKGVEIHDGNVPDLFRPAVNYVKSIEDKIAAYPDYIFYCETLCRFKHNVLQYKSVPKNNLVLFGAISPENICNWNSLTWFAEFFDIDVVPLIASDVDVSTISGGVSIELIEEWLDTESYLGGPKIEGVVIKCYEPYVSANITLPLWSAKYVSEKFKEAHSNMNNGDFNTKNNWEEFKKGYKTKARWMKSIQHLQENNILTNSPKDIGPLIQEINKDIREECREEIINFLWHHFGRDLLRQATSGFPEWYKKYLVERNV